MRLAGKVLVISGGNSGIGLAAAKLFVTEGAKVAITGRNEATLRDAAAALGYGVLALRADSNDYPWSQPYAPWCAHRPPTQPSSTRVLRFPDFATRARHQARAVRMWWRRTGVSG